MKAVRNSMPVMPRSIGPGSPPPHDQLKTSGKRPALPRAFLTMPTALATGPWDSFIAPPTASP